MNWLADRDEEWARESQGTQLYAGEAPKEKQEWPISCWCCGSPNWPKGSGGIEHAGVADPVAWWRASVYGGCMPVVTANPEEAQQWREEGHEVRELCFMGPNKGKNFPADDRG